MQGDQDVLTALLTSTEFADIPLKMLRRGKDIVQFDGVWGYTTTERLAEFAWRWTNVHSLYGH